MQYSVTYNPGRIISLNLICYSALNFTIPGFIDFLSFFTAQF
ncbi:hypothetical protein HMPREF0201_01821 [Cedecea davisae DSM 4568]|uniref:Uncharacterized protein n=1 Tax=Cedecea davisae DSM 4568 TaxID=566551 RepID=S3JCE4_9ENTR|nr:hypothetical protein HMPREF0201_01821 [Cedecea davisae DSM 4568]